MPIVESISEGREYGLSIIFMNIANQNKYPALYAKGLVVFVNNQSFSPLESDAVYLEPGTETNIAVIRTFSHNQPWPYSQCQDIANQTYRQENCLDLCLQKEIINACGCYFTKYLMEAQSEPCENVTQLDCINKQTNLFTRDFLESSLRECPLECDSLVYNLQISSLEFPNEQFYNMFLLDQTLYGLLSILLSDTPTFANIREISYKANVFYPHLQYTQISQTPKTSPFDLLSQIGGSLGVFLGLSFLHFVEIVEIGVVMLHGGIKMVLQRSSTKTVNPKMEKNEENGEHVF